MNPNQLATIDQANAMKAEIGSIGGGVVDTYIPEYEGPFSPPSNGDAMFYHFRFADGAEGVNVGLLIQQSKVFPTTWLNMLAEEIANQLNPPSTESLTGRTPAGTMGKAV
jgi:hypothetical protein